MARSVNVGAVVLLLAGCVGADAPTDDASGHESVAADVVVSWNERILEVAEAEDGFLTLKGVRAAAMLHLAAHDALAATGDQFHPFAFEADVPEVDPVAATNEAAYAVALAQYPDQQAVFDEERRRWLADRGTPSDEAASLGQQAADAILRLRRDDEWNTDPAYQWHPMGPGVYAEFNEHSGTPEGFVFGAGWAAARPFMLESAGQMRSPPPPEIESAAYTSAFREVKELGHRSSATRTIDQSHLAMWWKEFVEKSHNRLARELVSAEGLDLREANRLFALLNMGIYDGYVASFEGKFFYNHWRPYTAIRWAANDGNPDTHEDPDWTNLHDHTYAFPSYPSAHGTVCAAAMTMLVDVFGDDFPFEMTIPAVEAAGPMSPLVPMDPPTRSFDGFAQAAEECALSRVYLGIHFRYDSEAGTQLGREIAEYGLGRFLKRTG